MLLEFFVVGGVSFWLLVSAAMLLMLLCVENGEGWGWGLFIFAAVAVCSIVFGTLGAAIVAHPLYWLFAVVLYIVIGVCWTLPKWVLLLKRLQRDLKRLYADFCERKGINEPMTEIPEEHWGAWSHEVYYAGFWRYGVAFDNEGDAVGVLQPPAFSENRDRLITWALLWPWSMFWTLCRDVAMRIVTAVVDWWGGLYQRLADRIFEGLS